MLLEEKSLKSLFGKKNYLETFGTDYDDVYLLTEKDGLGEYGHRLVSRKNGKDTELDIEFSYEFGNHKVYSKNIIHICDLLSSRVSLDDTCARADLHNKTILGYCGKDSFNDKRWETLCNVCNSKFNQRSRYFNTCEVCGNKSRQKSFEEFQRRASLKHHDKYVYFSDDFKDFATKTKIYCKKCLKYFIQSPSTHVRGYGCPFCRESKGENKVANYLSSKNIKFVRNAVFSDLKDKSFLKFDFYLSDNSLLIEYDGEGHYLACFGSTLEEKIQNLLDCQRRDKIKDEWALKNNVPLLRIPYWDFNRIEELIDAFILKHSKREVKQLVLEM